MGIHKLQFIMEELLQENGQLKEMANSYFQQISELQERSKQHENQIETLLKFNEKLLGIIEKELQGHKIKNSDIISLQPISQKTQTQSEMFQSQLTNKVGQSHLNNFAAANLIAHQKRSLNLKPDFGYTRDKQPMENIDREEQLSIVVEGERERQNDHENGQITSLIYEFRKPIHTSDGNFTLAQVSHNIHEEVQEFQSLKQQSLNYYRQKIEQLRHYQNSIVNVDAKVQLSEMIGKVQGSEEAKNMILSFLQQL